MSRIASASASACAKDRHTLDITSIAQSRNLPYLSLCKPRVAMHDKCTCTTPLPPFSYRSSPRLTDSRQRELLHWQGSGMPGNGLAFSPRHTALRMRETLVCYIRCRLEVPPT